MQPGLINTHDLFIGIVSALMLLIHILILKAVDPVHKYTDIGLCWTVESLRFCVSSRV